MKGKRSEGDELEQRFAGSTKRQRIDEDGAFVNPLRAPKQGKQGGGRNEENGQDDAGYSSSELDALGPDVDESKAKKKKDKQKSEKGPGFEEVPAENFLHMEDYSSDELAETRSLAKKMLRKKSREQILDMTSGRY